MYRRLGFVLLLMLLPMCLGCTGEANKGKNKDLDRPKSAEKPDS